jgi:hypothetical protein
MPAQLARGGYVVVVPQLPDIGTHPSGEDHRAQAALLDVVSWIRDDWQHREIIESPPATGVVGHSYGALHACLLSSQIPCVALASLSGVWNDWPDGLPPLFDVELPLLTIWGTDPLAERDAIIPDASWRRLGRPRHRAIFKDGQHWDYLYGQDFPCGDSLGPCRYLGSAADDLVTMFMARYLPPDSWPNLPDLVPRDLSPPPLRLTPEQEFYAGGYLTGLSQFERTAGCSVELKVDLPDDCVVPFVRYLPESVARVRVTNADLVPVFTGSDGRDAWVRTQSPREGTSSRRGNNVRMTLATGPMP